MILRWMPKKFHNIMVRDRAIPRAYIKSGSIIIHIHLLFNYTSQNLTNIYVKVTLVCFLDTSGTKLALLYKQSIVLNDTPS